MLEKVADLYKLIFFMVRLGICCLVLSYSHIAISADKTSGLTPKDYGDACERGLIDENGNPVFQSVDNTDDTNNIVDAHYDSSVGTGTVVQRYATRNNEIIRPSNDISIEMQHLILEMIDGQNISAMRPSASAHDNTHYDNYRSNCHGYTFGGGRFWINNSEITPWFNQQALYEQINVDEYEQLQGDIVIWRRGGEIAHSAVIESPYHVSMMAGRNTYHDGRRVTQRHVASAWTDGSNPEYWGRIGRERSRIQTPVVAAIVFRPRPPILPIRVRRKMRAALITQNRLQIGIASLRSTVNQYEINRQNELELFISREIPTRFITGVANRF